MRGRNLHNRLVALESKRPTADSDLHFGGVPFDKIYDHLQADELDELKALLTEATDASAPEGIHDARICEILNLGIERFRRGDEPIDHFRPRAPRAHETYQRLKRERALKASAEAASRE